MIGPFIVIIAICIFFKMFKKGFSSTWDWSDGLLSIFVGTLVGIMISVFICIPVDILYEKKGEWVDTGAIPIVSIQPKDSISGSFCLGTGYIGSRQYYFAMKKLGENSYKPIKVEVDDVTSIYESNSEEPHFEVYKQQLTNKYLPYIFWKNNEVQAEYYCYRLIVPKGTVIKEYKVQ